LHHVQTISWGQQFSESGSMPLAINLSGSGSILGQYYYCDYLGCRDSPPPVSTPPSSAGGGPTFLPETFPAVKWGLLISSSFVLKTFDG